MVVQAGNSAGANHDLPDGERTIHAIITNEAKVDGAGLFQLILNEVQPQYRYPQLRIDVVVTGGRHKIGEVTLTLQPTLFSNPSDTFLWNPEAFTLSREGRTINCSSSQQGFLDHVIHVIRHCLTKHGNTSTFPWEYDDLRQNQQ